MNCPTCGSLLKERKTNTGADLLVCSKWPKCKTAGTTEVLERLRAPNQRQDDPVRLGAFVTQVAQLRIHQSRLRVAKTAEERGLIRQSAMEALK